MKKVIKLSSILAVGAILNFSSPAIAQTGDDASTTTTTRTGDDDDHRDWGWVGLAGLLGLLGLRKRNDTVHVERGGTTHNTNR